MGLFLFVGPALLRDYVPASAQVSVSACSDKLNVGASILTVNTILAYEWCMSKLPSAEPLIRKTVTLPESVWDEVREFRRSQGIGSEMETIRQLVINGLRGAERGIGRLKPRKDK